MKSTHNGVVIFKVRVYAPMFLRGKDEAPAKAFVIYRDEHEATWFVETEVDDVSVAKSLVDALNKRSEK